MGALLCRAAIPAALISVVAGFSFATPAFAGTSDINAADTAWMIVATALVLMMTLPGLALFYSGMVRKKNVLATMAQSLAAVAVISILWVAFGYSLAFVGDGPWLGTLDRWFLAGMTMDSVNPAAKTIPESLFMLYQMTFAIITVALVAGSVADRMRFSAYLLFSIAWFMFVYVPLAHWVWGGGFLQKMGLLDFAGGTVVHISSGVSALVCAWYLGKRVGYPHEAMPPHSMVLTFVGASMLWVGWFGFNAGSALSAGSLATSAFVATQLSAASGALSWSAVEWMRNGKTSALGAVSGAVAGLATVTQAAGFVGPMAALFIGVIAGVCCYFMVAVVKARFGYDDSLDAFGVHGVGGTLGALLTGVFASVAINPIFKDASGRSLAVGLVDGNSRQLLHQLAGVGAGWLLGAVGTLAILKLVDLTIGLRVSPEQEAQGLDTTQHGEEGYYWEVSPS